MPRLARFAPALVVLAAGCTLSTEEQPPPAPQNHPPEIREIRVSPSRLHRAEEGQLTAVVSDPDGDRMGFRWSARHGTFPLDRVRSSVPYRAPETGKADTVRFMATDGQDSSVVEREVRLADLAGPTGLRAQAGPDWVQLSWEPSIDERLFDFLGYLVYVSHASFREMEEPAWETYRITEDPVRSRVYLVPDLTPGRVYHFMVRAVRGTGEKSPYVEEKDTAPRPQGLGYQFREIAYPYATQAQGFDFSRGREVLFDPDEPADAAAVDVYLGTEAPDDGMGRLALKSPHLLSGRNPLWGQRRVGLKALGKDWAIGETDTTGFDSLVVLEKDLVVAVRLPEGHYAKFQVTDSLNAFPFRTIQYRWAYQTIPGYPRF
jgi:hypothetical protein